MSPPIGPRPSHSIANWFKAPPQLLIGIVHRWLRFFNPKYISLNTPSSFANNDPFFVIFRKFFLRSYPAFTVNTLPGIPLAGRKSFPHKRSKILPSLPLPVSRVLRKVGADIADARIFSEDSGSMIGTQDALDHEHASTTKTYVQTITVKKDKFSNSIRSRLG